MKKAIQYILETNPAGFIAFGIMLGYGTGMVVVMLIAFLSWILGE